MFLNLAILQSPRKKKNFQVTRLLGLGPQWVQGIAMPSGTCWANLMCNQPQQWSVRATGLEWSSSMQEHGPLVSPATPECLRIPGLLSQSSRTQGKSIFLQCVCLPGTISPRHLPWYWFQSSLSPVPFPTPLLYECQKPYIPNFLIVNAIELAYKLCISSPDD